MHGIDELERAPRIQAQALVPAPDPSPRLRLRPRAAAETPIPTEKLVPYAVIEEHEGGQYADKRPLRAHAFSPLLRRPARQRPRPPRRDPLKANAESSRAGLCFDSKHVSRGALVLRYSVAYEMNSSRLPSGSRK